MVLVRTPNGIWIGSSILAQLMAWSKSALVGWQQVGRLQIQYPSENMVLGPT